MMTGCNGGSRSSPQPPVTVFVSPSSATLLAGGTQSFTAAVGNTSNTSVTWTLLDGYPNGSACPTACGSLSSTTANPVTYTAPPSPPAKDELFTIVATSQAYPTITSDAAITFRAIGVAVSPESVLNLSLGATQTFTDTVTGDSSASGVTWDLTRGGTACSSGCGSLSETTSAGNSGSTTYTAPSSPPGTLGGVILTAASVKDPSKTAPATIYLPVAGTNDSELKGNYALLFNGFASAGSQVAWDAAIVANGTGDITSGELAECQGPGPNSGLPASEQVCPGAFGTVTGTYSLGSDNRGTMTLTFADGGTSLSHTYVISAGAISNGIAQKAQFIEFDNSSGNSGVDGSGFGSGPVPPLGMVGTASFDGSGNVTGGSYTAPDANGVGSFTITFSSASSVTPTHWGYIVVDAAHLLAVSTDTPASFAVVGGEMLLQTGAPFTDASLSGNGVLCISGYTAMCGPLCDEQSLVAQGKVGVATANGAGNFTTFTEEDGSGTSSTQTGVTYSVAANGRARTSGASDNLILYLVNTDEALVLGVGNYLELGFLEPQSAGPFSASAISGNYFFGSAPPVVRLSGCSGTATSTGSGTLNGTVDGSLGAPLSSAAFSDSLTVTSSTLGRITDGAGGIIYVISPGKFVMIGPVYAGYNTCPTANVFEQ